MGYDQGLTFGAQHLIQGERIKTVFQASEKAMQRFEERKRRERSLCPVTRESYKLNTYDMPKPCSFDSISQVKQLWLNLTYRKQQIGFLSLEKARTINNYSTQAQDPAKAIRESQRSLFQTFTDVYFRRKYATINMSMSMGARLLMSLIISFSYSTSLIVLTMGETTK